MIDKTKNGAEPDLILEGRAKIEVTEGACVLDRPMDPCTIIILGASGDLTSRKLMPALYNLFCMGGLPEPFRIVGCARTEVSDDKFREKMEESVKGEDYDPKCWRDFSSNLHYKTLIYDAPDSFDELADYLNELDCSAGTGGNRVLYLALPMFLYGKTAELLGASGLAGDGGNGWTRLVVEKPYGSDRESAAELDSVIHKSFTEEQIYRIDHYLAKETVQSILTLRFANAIFEPLWNRNYIEYVDIVASETLGVEKRAGYYDKSGVLRDMFQNHMLQLLALTAMEPPNRFQSAAVREEKIKVFKCLRPFPVDNLFENLVLGQYGPGTMDGKPVKGYREEEGVASDSMTPTFGMMRIFIDNWRWKGVPFFLTSGKRLGAKLTQIAIRFRDVPVTMFGDELGIPISANILTLGIQPREHIALTFQTKTPGAKMCLRTVQMDFDYLQGYSGPSLKAYEKALLDCMNGDQMLFWHREGVDLAWTFIEPILQRCESCEHREQILQIYDPGSWGPSAAQQLKELMEAECR